MEKQPARHNAKMAGLISLQIPDELPDHPFMPTLRPLAFLILACLSLAPGASSATAASSNQLRAELEHAIPAARKSPALPLGDLAETVHVRRPMFRLREKLDSEKPVRVVYLGGSITQNTSGHTKMVSDLLRAMKSPSGRKAEFSFINAGLSSTCSTSGAFRLASQALAAGPVDLLIVEFAVNDDQDAGHPYDVCVRGMEGIVRHTRNHSPDAEIVIVHYLNPGMLETLQSGKTPATIKAHESVAEHYGLASVNVAASVAGSVKQGQYAWKDYGGTHPKPFGYLVASAHIYHAVSEGLRLAGASELKNNAHALPAPLNPECYDAGVFVSPGKADRSSGWKSGKVTKDLMPVGAVRSQFNNYDAIRADAPGNSLTLRFNGRAVGAFILAGPDAGIVETRIDGGAWKSHNLYHRFSSSLNYPRSVMFHTGLKRGEHSLELRISAATDARSKGHAATILNFEVNE